MKSNYCRSVARTQIALSVAILFILSILFILNGLACSDDKHGTEANRRANKEAEKIAQKVKRKAERSEKAEGRQDLIKDKVTVKTGTDGKPVVEQLGEASYYGPGFHGKKTATGEKFDQNHLTAAHPSLPLGTKATVTNLENGNSVDVKINDRGPYVKGRDIDLSKGAAKELGIGKKEGVAPVKIEAEVKTDEKNSQRKKEADQK
ncbi:MAG TPA: septal ring lytic transglycosylase RlpA family protein [Candidatus Binatia bacterium]